MRGKGYGREGLGEGRVRRGKGYGREEMKEGGREWKEYKGSGLPHKLQQER